ncbi:MAG: hypothetical protein IKH44_15565 [Bacteroidales bacterium]|nr:hypothetical protein [Bacteroidales bacterium]MBR4536248.1 hypothetical protein [Bacteroidales bacterium]
MTTIDKYHLSLAGEYAVCSELCKRGFDVSITLGNAKATDIIVFFPDNSCRRIEVKTSQNGRFVTNFFQKYYDKTLNNHPDYWVLVYIDEDGQFHYYVLTHEELGEIQMKRNGMSTWGKHVGCDNVLVRDVAHCENQWGKIK